MADVIVHGSPFSTYARTVRMALVEKGVDYELNPLVPGTEECQKLHPFGKVPIFQHGDFTLWESLAIVRYIDEVFEGTPLEPGDAQSRGLMNQMISAIMDYFYPSMVRQIILPRLIFPARGMEVDEDAIKAAVPDVETQFLVISGFLQDHSYLASDTLTMADLFLSPILYYMNFTPEGREIVGKSPRILRWMETMGSRPSDKDTLPPIEKLQGN